MPDTLTVPPLGPAAGEEPALDVCVWDYVARTVTWLDAANGRGPHETAVRVMKIAEEAGEAVAAYLGLTGANPRKISQGLRCQLVWFRRRGFAGETRRLFRRRGYGS